MGHKVFGFAAKLRDHRVRIRDVVQTAHAKSNIYRRCIHVMHVLADKLDLRFVENLSHQPASLNILAHQFHASNSRRVVLLRNPEGVETVISKCFQE